MTPPLQLTQDFKFALDALEKEGKNLFITGRAGTGKSTLLRLFRQTTRKKTVVLAPTGIAALNVRGQTIHSFFGLPPRMMNSSDIKKSRKREKLLKALEVLVIDEISMVRADLLDAISYSLKLHRGNPLPFGGVQMVFFGDLFQLPPVVASEMERLLLERQGYDSPYFFSAHVFREGFQMEMLELQRVFRQEQKHFLRLLEAIRRNQADWEDLEDLNERCDPDFQPGEFFVTLSPYNRKVDQINERELAKITAPEKIYTARIEGQVDTKQFPADPVLRLKEGAQVMFVRNDQEEDRFVNGTIGQVTQLGDDTIQVEVEEGGTRRSIEVERMEWEIIRYKLASEGGNQIDYEVVGTFTQFPLKLAWAVTIHKSQGKTFDKVVIDMGRGAFEHGQTYVALSRCRTLEGIVLKRPLRPQDILLDERIVEFYEQCQR